MEKVSDLLKLRREKLDTLIELKISPYKYQFDVSNYANEVLEKFDEFENNSVSIAGRMMSVRLMGKAAFFHLQDQSGKIQVYIRKDKVGDDAFEVFKLLDIGDIVGITGTVFKTRTDEISVLAEEFELLSKSIKPFIWISASSSLIIILFH